VGITNDVPFSEFLFVDVPVREEQDTLLALTDESGSQNVLGDGLIEDSDEREPTPEDLAEGLANVQAYEDEQRQEFAAETVEAVMQADEPTEPQVLETAEVLPAQPAELEVKPA
jgi:hypothetical protein